MRLVSLTLVSLVVGASVWACGGDDGPDPSATGGQGGDTGDGDGDTDTGTDTNTGDGDPGDGDGDGSGGGDGDGDGTGGGGGGDECVGDATRCTDDESEVDVCVAGNWVTQECRSAIPLCEGGICDPENCAGCLIDGQCYPDGTPSPENSCQVCDAPAGNWKDVSDGTSCGNNGSCDAGSCACADGWTGGDCGTCVVYVKTDGNDDESGLSWNGALADINVALEFASSRRIDEELDTCQVWAAEGTYKPGTELTSTFQLQEHVGLYGGFAGNETLLSQRDWEEHETILSGDLAGDDAAGDLLTPASPLHRDDNVYHLVTAATDARLDGLIIQSGGNGAVPSGDTENGSGGGVLVAEATIEIHHSILRDNYSRYEGAALHSTESELTVSASQLSSNVARSGRAAWIEASDAAFETVEAFDNEGSGSLCGGALATNASNVTFKQATFERNKGSLCFERDTVAMLSGCTFEDNTSTQTGAAIVANRATVSILDGIFRGNSTIASSGNALGGAIELLALAQATIVSSRFEDNFSQSTQPDYGGAIHVRGGAQLALANSVFNGNLAGSGSAISVSDETSSVSITSCTFADNDDPSGQGGTLWNLKGTVTVHNSIFWNGRMPAIVNSDIAADPVTVGYSDVEGGYDGDGNIDSDPLFSDAEGGDYRLTNESPSKDAGDNSLLPTDALDLDGDGNISEPLPLDIDGNPRVSGASVDMGAYERP